jgi:hypothetical protein
LRIYCRTCGRHSADHHSIFAPVEVLFNSTVPARIQVRVTRIRSLFGTAQLGR